MRHLVAAEGLEDEISIESAGTGDWHVGNPRDRRSRAVGEARGIPLSGKAQQFTARDFARYDHVIAMDRSNRDELRRMAPTAADARQDPPAAFVRRERASPTPTCPTRITAGRAGSRRCSTSASAPARACWPRCGARRTALLTWTAGCAATLAAALGSPVAGARPLSGGDINDAYEVTLDDGRTLFVKSNASAPGDMFIAEARGLAWLGEAKALRVPAVVAASGATT